MPGILEKSLIDEIKTVSGPDAMEMARRLAVQEGLMVGISSGAAVHAALEIAKKNKDKMVVVIIPSFGERYLSSMLFEHIQTECKAMVTTQI